MLDIKYAHYIFKLYMLTGIRSVIVGECSSGETAIFAILSRKKKKHGSITSAVCYLVPLHIKASVI